MFRIIKNTKYINCKDCELIFAAKKITIFSCDIRKDREITCIVYVILITSERKLYAYQKTV